MTHENKHEAAGGWQGDRTLQRKISVAQTQDAETFITSIRGAGWLQCFKENMQYAVLRVQVLNA